MGERIVQSIANGPVAVLTLDRPKALNAHNGADLRIGVRSLERRSQLFHQKAVERIESFGAVQC